MKGFVKPKRMSYRELQKRLTAQTERAEYFRLEWVREQATVAHLNKKVAERLDTAMLAERIKLANAVGQMMTVVTDAVRVIIGKEMF